MHIGNKPNKKDTYEDEDIYDYEDIDEDEDEYDDDDDDEYEEEGTFIQRVMASMDLKSWIVVGVGGVVGILFLMFMLQDKKPVKESKDTSPASSVIAKKSTKKSSSNKSIEKSSESSSSTETSSSEKTDEAKEKIEKTLDSKTPAPQDVLDALNNAVNAAQSDVQANQMNVQPADANHLAATHTSMVSTFAMAIVYNGYTVSKTEAYMTNDEGVYQIIITMSAPNKSNLYFNGFYSSDQLRLTEYSGGQIGATFG